MSDDEVTPQNGAWLYRVGGGMLIGVAIGSVLGLTVVDNIALGGGIGMILGIIVGSAIHVLKKH
jgi:hypothetical protein